MSTHQKQKRETEVTEKRKIQNVLLYVKHTVSNTFCSIYVSSWSASAALSRYDI